MVRGLLRVRWRLEVSGLEHLPPPPYLITPNHGSELDAVVLSAALPFRPTYLAARELERFPWLFRLIRWFNPVFVRRGLADVGSVKACIARLQGGDVLVIFPEGRVVPDGELGPFHPGAAFVALRAGVPLVPVALTGVARMWPLGARWPRASRLRVRIAGPMVHQPGATPESLTVQLRDVLTRMLREVDAPPAGLESGCVV